MAAEPTIPVRSRSRLEFFEDRPEIAECQRRADVAAELERQIDDMEAEQDRNQVERAAFLRQLEANFGSQEQGYER